MKQYRFDSTLSHDGNIGLIRYVANEDEELHTHEFLEIVYILSGQGRHCVNGAWYPVRRGNLLFLNFGQTHAFHLEGEMEQVNFLLSPDFIDRELLRSENAVEILMLSSFQDFNLGADKLVPVLRFDGRNMLEVEALIHSMLDEYHTKRTNYMTALKGYTLVLLTKVFRAMQDMDAGHLLGQMGRITPDILRHIEDNCFEKITLQELAQKCFYNPSYFSRVFKECFGKSLTEYIAERRMAEAQRLLAETSLTVEDVCARVGYSDRKQFYKLFKEHTGVTPSAYRKVGG